MFTGILSKRISAGLAAIVFASLLLPSTALAGEVQNRIHNQQVRINQGVRNGTLTRGEYNRDESRLNADRFARNRDLSRNGGRFANGQKANLNRRLNNNSRDIYNTKHNAANQRGY